MGLSVSKRKLEIESKLAMTDDLERMRKSGLFRFNLQARVLALCLSGLTPANRWCELRMAYIFANFEFLQLTVDSFDSYEFSTILDVKFIDSALKFNVIFKK